MYSALSLPALGVDVDVERSIELAAGYGFDAVELDPRAVAAAGAEEVRARLEDRGLRLAGFLLPLEWHEGEEEWRRGLEELPALVDAAMAAGSDRAFTWIWPFSEELDWDPNWQFHLDRLGPVVECLDAAGCRLALEYVGPPTMRAGHRFEFIHRPADALRLAEGLGANVGVLLDTFHWYTTGSDRDELQALPAERIAYVHINDAPVGVEPERQDDLVRSLPLATGVIEIAAFLAIVAASGYQGPVVAEPFEAAMTAVGEGPDARVAATAAAVAEAISLGSRA